MNFFLKIFLSIALLFIASCKQRTVEIVNNSRNVYDRNSEANAAKYRNFINSTKKQEDTIIEEDLPESAQKNVEQKTEEKKSQQNQNQIEVVAGDTLYSVSRRYQVNLRDLIEQNNLAAPYALRIGSKLTIPASIQNYHEVKTGETLYAISRIYGVKIDGLIEINNMQEPYIVKPGQKIIISKTSIAKATSYQLVSPKKAPENFAESSKLNNSAKPKDEAKKEGIVDKVLDKLSHFSWPIKGPVVSKFGPKTGGLYNDGINIKAKAGDPVKASESGVVAYVGNELKGYGNLIIVKHSSGWITAYAHLSSAVVARGQKVSKGEKIGSVGATGNVTSPQLYFGLRKGRDAVNPENYLK